MIFYLMSFSLLGIPSPMKQNLEYRASQVQSGPLGTNITLIVVSSMHVGAILVSVTFAMDCLDIGHG